MEKISMRSSLVGESISPGPFTSDIQFDELYPISIQRLSEKHWTPLPVARRAAQFLAVKNNVKILDIGSGVGKFCLIAAHFRPRAFYYGVEQRRRLIYHADKTKELLRQRNVSFLHGNFTQINFGDYDHFYFYNSFFENLSGTNKIDESIDYSAELFFYYHNYFYKQLEQRPAGTRLVTFHSLVDEIPPCYHVVANERENRLKFWIKR
jgi:SAM-dependent methyltransferase